MSTNELKQKAALAALEYVREQEVIGVGTGSTVNFFIDALSAIGADLRGAVSSSEASSRRLREIGIPVLDLNEVNGVPVYVDGADEANNLRELIKGGGGALTREKIIAAASGKFVCIVDQSKMVAALGSFPLPIEVIPMARSYVAREIVRLGGRPSLREGFISDNGNQILDVRGLDYSRPVALEERINNIAGVVTVGLFAQRPADVLLVARGDRVERI